MGKRAYSRGLWVISVLFYCMTETVIAGTVVGWGLNNDGETTPPEGTDFTVVAAGSSHCLALKADGSIVGWGGNADGEATPPAGTGYLAIAAGYEHSLALKADGSIIGWGDESEGRWAIPEGNDFVAIADGSFHCLAVKSDGTVVGWGFDLMDQATPPDGNDFVAVAAGNYHSLALRSDGSVVCWGHDSDGQGTSPDGNDFVAIDAGRNHNVALKKDGSIFCWGDDSNGQASPPDGNDFVAVAAGMWHSLALKKDGSIVCWGRNEHGERTPPKGNDFLAVDGGYYYSVAIRRYGGGSGEPNDPYLIYNSEQMNEIGLGENWDDWDKCFKLMADIDLSEFTGTSFNIIGTETTAFTGTFDGNDHTIANFTYDTNGIDLIGLFRISLGEIKNLGLIHPNVDAETGAGIGSLVGYLSNGTVTNCYVEGGTVSGEVMVGSLVGANFDGMVENCHSIGLVSGNEHVGGIVGDNYLGTVENSHATGTVIAVSGAAGGLVGVNSGTIKYSYSHGEVRGKLTVGGLTGSNITNVHGGFGKIDNCYSTANVMATNRIAGGLMGINYTIVKNCYAAGNIDGNSLTGGLAGVNYGGTLENCYAIGSVEGNSGVGGLVGVTRESTIKYCYAVGEVLGDVNTGGLVGSTYDINNDFYTKCFWDNTVNSGLPGIGNTSDPNVIGESTANMQTQSTFTDAAWDFIDIWDICELTNYPKFIWQIPIGDFVCPDGVNFIDYSFFTSHWKQDNCGVSNDCDGTDLDLLGTVDFNDLRILVDNWLRGF